MELRHLRYFVGVAEELNFTRAAGRLRVAQPALSRQIRQLEEEIGVTLLDRGTRGVTLTAVGATFLEEARSILARSEAAVRAAQSGPTPGGGVLNLGYVWGLFHTMVPEIVERFRRRAPDTSVNLFDLTATRQAAALEEGGIDVGFIGFAEEAEAAGLASRKVGSCAWLAALPAAHPAARKRKVPIGLLAGGTFLTISDEAFPGAARFVSRACSAAGFRPRVVQAADRGHTLLTLVAGNCGVALVPESLMALPHSGVVFRPLQELPRADLFVAWSTRRASGERDLFLETMNATGPSPR